MALATIPGYPRIGKRRELKRALEGYWSGKRTAAELEETAAAIRRANWDAQTAAGLDLVPVNDFSLYDQVLDTCALVGAIPPRFGWTGGTVDLDLLFAMARGGAGDEPARAMELTKWFDTNYHYLVPEFSADQTFRLASDKPFAELAEAQAAGVPAKPVLLGPITFLLLGKMTGGDDAPLALPARCAPAGLCRGHPAAGRRRRGVDPARRAGPGARSHPGSARRRRAGLRRSCRGEGRRQTAAADRLRPRRRGLSDAGGAAGRRHRARFRTRTGEPRSHRAAWLPGRQMAGGGSRRWAQRLDERPRRLARSARSHPGACPCASG